MASGFRRRVRSVKLWRVAPAVAVAALLAMGDVLVFGRQEPRPALARPTAAQRGEFLKWYRGQPRLTSPVDRGKARVLIVAFMDFQCATCRLMHETLGPLLVEYDRARPGQVAVAFKHFPLDPLCNPAVTKAVHIAGCESAVAFELARQKHSGAKMEDWLYDHLEALNPDTVRMGVRQVLGIQDFDRRYPIVVRDVERDIALGRAIGVDAVPTFFVNGVRIRGGVHQDLLGAVIDFELEHRQ